MEGLLNYFLDITKITELYLERNLTKYYIRKEMILAIQSDIKMYVATYMKNYPRKPLQIELNIHITLLYREHYIHKFLYKIFLCYLCILLY